MEHEDAMRRLASMQKEISEYINRIAPLRAAEIAVRAFKNNFAKEGFFGERWKEVKRRQAYERKTFRNGKIRRQWKPARDPGGRTRMILKGPGPGDLGRSIRKKIVGDGAALIYPDVHVKGKDGVSYAEVHNAGLRAGRGKGFVMPKRRFIGDHKGYTYQEGASQAQNLQFYPFYNTL